MSAGKGAPREGRPARRPWRRCAACLGVCHWWEDHWVCDDDVAGCGAEWNEDHDPKYRAPGD